MSRSIGGIVTLIEDGLTGMEIDQEESVSIEDGSVVMRCAVGSRLEDGLAGMEIDQEESASIEDGSAVLGTAVGSRSELERLRQKKRYHEDEEYRNRQLSGKRTKYHTDTEYRNAKRSSSNMYKHIDR